ncbi:unnamed protein product [Timema podura]|uniref:Uncharacterized protein n=1 Tax=Timema podura TaxID=61482 RepID=A0ABN7NF94_TIMPD|nr:unnamed protein product [Timema podura]
MKEYFVIGAVVKETKSRFGKQHLAFVQENQETRLKEQPKPKGQLEKATNSKKTTVVERGRKKAEVNLVNEEPTNSRSRRRAAQPKAKTPSPVKVLSPMKTRMFYLNNFYSSITKIIKPFMDFFHSHQSFFEPLVKIEAQCIPLLYNSCHNSEQR